MKVRLCTLKNDKVFPPFYNCLVGWCDVDNENGTVKCCDDEPIEENCNRIIEVREEEIE